MKDVIRLVTLMLAFGFGYSVHGQRTDTLVLKDQTRHIGEIKSLTYEKLTYWTKYMGTVKITWTNITRLMSEKQFTIRTGHGEVYHGSLLDPGRDYFISLLRKEDSVIVPLQMGYIVELVPVRKRAIYRFYGNVDAGFSFTKASQVRQINFGANVGYRLDDYDINFIYNDINTVQGDIDRTTIKRDINLSGTRYWKRRIQNFVTVGLQKNTELGIERRTIIGAGLGKGLIQHPRNRITLLVAPIFNREQYVQDQTDSLPDNQGQSSAEALASLEWRAFHYGFPELDFFATTQYFYTLSAGDRHRINLDISLSYEIIDDFYITWTFYDNFDSNTPSDNTSSNDWGTTFGLRFAFKQSAREKRKKKGDPDD